MKSFLVISKLKYPKHEKLVVGLSNADRGRRLR